MKVKVKRRNEEVEIPKYQKEGDVGMDLTAVEVEVSGNWYFPIFTYKTGIALDIPKNYWVLLTPRSSISKKLMWMANSVGVIDTGYRGEIILKFRSILGINPYKTGERIGQMILMKKYKMELEETNNLSVTDRGNKGFGSTGK
ncbi:MAG: dUTP diphosphatase [Senegalia sp. (in: firmicutes)]